jgi:hypothetical protein
VVDVIEVHFDRRRRELSLTCGNVAFARVPEAVTTAADLDEMVIVCRTRTCLHATRLSGVCKIE